MNDFLRKLVKTSCLPQFQDRMEDLLRREVDFAEVEIDRLGNVHLSHESSDDTVVLLAHLSEIGFAVEHVDDSGFLRFKETSNVEKRSILGQRVMVHTEKGGVRGLVGVTPPHLLKKEEREKVVEFEDMFVDVGAYSREDAEDMGISVGDPFTLEGWFKELPDGRLVGKALDDRLGCYVVLMVLEELVSEGIGPSAVLLSQEQTFPRQFDPEYAIAVDATLAGPYPKEISKAEPYEVPIEIGNGPALTLSEGGVSVSQEVRELMQRASKKSGVTLQIEASSRSDVDRINPMKYEVLAAILSIPVKYIRTPGEIASVKDVDGTIEFLKSFVKEVIE